MASRNFRRIGRILLCAGLYVFAVACRDVEPSGKEQKMTATKTYGGVYRYALGHEPITLDPALIRGIFALSVVQHVFDGLVQFDADLNVVPSIAHFWKASHDGRIWTFNIRPGVTFHHGREVMAEDFVYSFTRLMHPKTGSPHAGFFEMVQGAKPFIRGEIERIDGLRALDTYTLQIILSQPYAPFIRMLGMAQAKVVPREEVSRLGARFGLQPIGTGPFRFDQWAAGKEIVLEANATYLEGRPFLDQLRYRFFLGTDRQTILPAFQQGALEDTGIPLSLSLPKRQQLIRDARYRFFRKPILATLFLLFNTRESPLSHPQVRRAINLAINHERINRTIRQNRHVQARSVFPPGVRGHNPNLSGYSYDPARARQLLAAAGYPDGKGLPPIALWSSSMTSGTPTVVAEHEAIQDDLQHIGITVELHNAKSWKNFKTNILGKRPRAMYRYAWYADFPDPDNFLFVLFHSKGADNHANYSNPQVDWLLEQARSERDDLQRVGLYRKAEKLIVEEAPIVNLVHYTFERLFQSYVKGIELNALGRPYIPLKKIWLDTSHRALSNRATSP